MHYASKTYENIEATRQAGLWGISMPRRYGGLNMPITPYSMASEIVATADAGFQNIWSLQDCIETLYEFCLLYTSVKHSEKCHNGNLLACLTLDAVGNRKMIL